MEADHLYVNAALCVLADEDIEPSASIELHHTRPNLDKNQQLV